MKVIVVAGIVPYESNCDFLLLCLKNLLDIMQQKLYNIYVRLNK